MILGEHNRQQDLAVNICKTQKLTNMRSAGSEALEGLTPPIVVTLELAMDFMTADKLMEITPKSIRLRKVDMDVRI